MLADILDAEGAALAAELGASALYHHLDVTDADGWKTVVAAARRPSGPVDVLVNNAGIANAAPIEHFPIEKWNAVLAVNLTGNLLRHPGGHPRDEAARPRLDHQRLVRRGPARRQDAARLRRPSKFAVRGLTKSVAVEVGEFGIRVNSIHPGFIETPMTAKWSSDGLHIPLGPRGPARGGLEARRLLSQR